MRLEIIVNLKQIAMKRIFLFVMVLCAMAVTVNAQKTYLRLGLGGGVGLKSYEGDQWANETYTSSSDNYEIKSMGLGGGFNAGLAVGYMLSDNIGLELGVNYFFGLNKKIHYSDTYGNTTDEVDVKMSGSMLQLVPALVITPNLEKLNPYARLGMIVGILPSVVEKVNATYTTGNPTKATTEEVYKEKNSGGVAMGFTAAVGATLKLSEKFDFFGELMFNGITYAPTKGKVKEWTVDGADQLPNATTKMKEWEYVKKYDDDENIPDGSKNKRPKESVNFSNVELNIGIRFNL
jgi:opacity protein-like surface antigen